MNKSTKLRDLSIVTTPADRKAMREVLVEVARNVRTGATHGFIVIEFKPGSEWRAHAGGFRFQQTAVAATQSVAARELKRYDAS